MNFLNALGANADVVNTAVEAVRWVANALMSIGIVVVAVNLIRTGIQLSGADSPEAANKCKKRILYCIIGLVIIVSALTVINILVPYIKDWIAQHS